MILISNICILIIILLGILALSFIVGILLNELVNVTIDYNNRNMEIGIILLIFILSITAFIPKVCIWLF